MRSNNPIISTAKVRGLIKKNGIGYVDATRRLYPSIAKGISVWQLCDTVYIQFYGNDATLEEKFANILATQGLTFTKRSSSFEIVKADA